MKLIPSSVSRTVASQILAAKKNSPHIFFVGGVAGVVGAAYLACRATLKLEATVDEIKIDLENAKVKQDIVDQPEKEYTKDLVVVYAKSMVKVGKLYGPSVVVGSLSIAALTGSHIQLTRRNTALTATLAAAMKAFDEYREKVRAELGEERELEIHRGIEVVKNDKKELVKIVSESGLSPYARLFDETTTHNWVKSSDLNYIFLKCQQQYANDLLNARGHLFLNEVYTTLGFEHTQAGAVVGWIVDKHGDSDGDGYVDFGIFEAINDRFVKGWEPSIWLDFNVDGPVHHLLENKY